MLKTRIYSDKTSEWFADFHHQSPYKSKKLPGKYPGKVLEYFLCQGVGTLKIVLENFVLNNF